MATAPTPGSVNPAYILDTLASPVCAVDLYPWEGGSFSFSGSQVLECTTTKNLRDAGGTATIILPPGGPNGQGFPSWSQVVTLQSLVVIAMQRGSQSNIVFIGIVRAVEEDQEWQEGQGVTRNTRISAMDWGAWFQDFNWSALSFLAVTNGQAYAFGSGTDPQAGLPSTVLGWESTNPASIAYGWYSKIMAGTQGILADTNIQYNNNTIPWNNATLAYFESYPYNAIFPASTMTLSQDGSWYAKFAEILETPYYELIVGTAPVDTWMANVDVVTLQTTEGQISLEESANTSAGATAWISPYSTTIRSLGLPNAISAVPQIVGRVNPLPDLTLALGTTQPSQGAQGQQAFVYSGVDMTRWNQLPNYALDPTAGFTASRNSLEIDEYYNFFVLNPVFYKTITGIGASPGIFIYAYSGAANLAGIHRFGLKSMIRDTNWMSDPSNQVAESQPGMDLENLVNALTTRLATFYTPLPVMNNATVEFRLSPGIFVGGRFTYNPFRGDGPWTYYINSVSHTYKFGGPSATTLGLERGLPASVYADPALLQQVLEGQAMRLNGSIFPGLPASEGPGLQTFGMATTSIKTVLAGMAHVYATAGAS